MTRTMWLAAVPRCRDGHVLHYADDLNRWFCMRDGFEVRGEVLARGRGFDTRMRFAAVSE